MTVTAAPYRIVAFYRFVPVADLAAHQAALKALSETYNLCGTILIAPEGLNGTIASNDAGIDAVVDYLDARFQLRQGQVKYSGASAKPFQRYKVRIKKEIITLRHPEANPSVRVGTYVEPAGWNALLADPDVTVIDTRNAYETKIGVFKGALDPQLNVFTDFPDYVAKHLDPQQHKKVAMFCTGGIRCEKASSYMLAQGFKEVYHLKGGILKYLEDVPASDSQWQGECFVFDNRVGVGHGLAEGDSCLCFGCREPLTESDRDHPHYEEGVSCAHCHDALSADDIARKRMRHDHIMANRRAAS